MRVVQSRPTDQVMTNFKQKFDLPARPPMEIPTIPDLLDELSDSRLMALYNEFMAWVSYAKAEYVQAEIAEERAENDMRVTESLTLIGQWNDKTKGDTVTLAKAKRDVDTSVINARNAYSESRAYRKLVESVFERCERGAQVLSRELSRRIGLAPQERRNARFNP